MTPELALRQQVESHRPNHPRPEPGSQPLGTLNEKEATNRHGDQANTLTIFLRGSECRFRCVMCDLWQHTHATATQPGAIAAQVTEVCRSVESLDWVKLYNASNFFDPFNVPFGDLPQIAQSVRSAQRVVVENHPRILPKRTILDFQSKLEGQLEIAMGLEVADDRLLAKLNKSMTLADFSRTAEWFVQHRIDVRAFVLFQPPWTQPDESIESCLNTIRFAAESGARHVSLIPVRAGNGFVDQLARSGEFHPPRANQLEDAFDQALLETCSSVMTVDLWDWDQMLGHCDACRERRRSRLAEMNLQQIVLPRVTCSCSC